MESYLEIGKIVNTHGIRGAIKIIPFTDDPSRFELLKYIIVCKKSQAVKYYIESVKYHKQFVILQLKEIQSINEAEELKDSIVEIPKELALPLEKDEYYIGDLYDLKVFTEEDQFLGIIVDIIFTGSNEVYVVKDDSMQSHKEILIPAIKDCIKNIDLEKGVMKVTLLEGLEEL